MSNIVNYILRCIIISSLLLFAINHCMNQSINEITIIEFDREYQDFTFRADLNGARCIYHPQHVKCNLNVSQRHLPEETELYGFRKPVKGTVTWVVCKGDYARAFNPLLGRKKIIFSNVINNYISADGCYPLLLGDKDEIVTTFELVSHLNTQTTDDPTLGPGHWYDIVLTNHEDQIRKEILTSGKHVNYTESELEKYASFFVFQEHQFIQLFIWLSQYNWTQRTNEWKIAVARQSGVVFSLDLSYKAIKKVYEYYQSNVSNTNSSIIQYDPQKKWNSLDVAIMTSQNEFHFSHFAIMVPDDKESHNVTMPPVIDALALELHFSDNTLLFKSDGLEGQKNYAEKLTERMINQFGNDINGYDMQEFSAGWDVASDIFHRVGRLWEQGAIRDGDKEANLACQDRALVGRQVNNETKYIVIKEDEYDFISFMNKYQHIYNNDENTDKIINYTKFKCLERRTYSPEGRDYIREHLQPGSDDWCKAIAFWEFAVARLPLGHWNYFTTYAFGFRTFEQMMTDLDENGNRVLQIIDAEAMNYEIKQVDVPKWVLPPQFTFHVARSLQILWLTPQMLVSHGFHTFSHHENALKTFYNVYEDKHRKGVWQYLPEKNPSLPIFYGQNYEEHRDRELKFDNLNMMYNNTKQPNKIFGGIMGNEFQHVLKSRHKITRGKYGYYRAKKSLNLMYCKYNTQIFGLYNESCPKREQLKFECGFSQDLWKYMQNIINNTKSIGPLLQHIKKNGIFIVDANVEKATEFEFTDSIKEQLLGVVDECKLIWTKEMFLALVEYCSQIHGQSAYISKQLHLPKIKNIYCDKLSDSFLERRLNDINLYFVD